MLTAQHEKFIIIKAVYHPEWPVEYADIVWTEERSITRIAELLNAGVEVRFRAPLDAEGDTIKEDCRYTCKQVDNGKTWFTVKIDYDKRIVKTSKRDFGFFSFPTFKKYYETEPVCNHRYFIADMRYEGGRLSQVQKTCALCGEASDWMTVHDEGDPIGHNGDMGVPGHEPTFGTAFFCWDFKKQRAKHDVWHDTGIDNERLFFGNFFSTKEACNEWAIMRGLKQD